MPPTLLTLTPARRKIPKTLSGIETSLTFPFCVYLGCAAKYLKPYQGLKLVNRNSGWSATSRKIPKTLSGIETRQVQRDQ